MTHNPFALYPVTDTWADHIARGSGGGIDYAMPVGTPLPASADGVLTNDDNDGTGGYAAIVTHPDGSQTWYLHLSQFTTPRTVKKGEIIGYSGGKEGATGAGNSTGPHLHAHDINANGTRVPPFTTGSPSTGGNILDALNPFSGIAKQLEWFSTPGNIARIGLFALGGTLLLIAGITLITKTDTGQAVVSSAKNTAKTAATVAAVIPK